jgi:hypothetical protein
MRKILAEFLSANIQPTKIFLTRMKKPWVQKKRFLKHDSEN